MRTAIELTLLAGMSFLLSYGIPLLGIALPLFITGMEWLYYRKLHPTNRTICITMLIGAVAGCLAHFIFM